MRLNKLTKQKGYGLFEVLLTTMIVMLLVSGFFYLYMEKQKELKAIMFGKDMVSIITAFDKRIHVDGLDIENFKNGTNWTNSASVMQMLNTEFIAKNASCGISNGWVPALATEKNTKLISCNFWNKIPYNFEVKAKINADSQGFIKNFMIIFEPKNADSFSKEFRFYNKAKLIASSNDSLSLTGGHDFYFARSSDPLTKITSMECLAAKINCNLVAIYDRQGGNEYLRVDGTNSMLGSVVTFKASKSDNKLSCVRWEKDKTSSIWSSSIVDCGIGIYNKTNTPVAVEITTDSITSKQLMLDKLCPIFKNSVDGIIDTSETTPCGMVPQDDNGVEVAYQIVDTVSARKGLIKTLYSDDIFTDQVNANYVNVKKDLSVLGNTTMDGTLSVKGVAQFDGNINLTKIESAGFYCAPNGLVARDNKGAILSCQGSKWTLVGAASVLTGSITHGQQIPLPAGKIQSQCTFSVSSANNAHPGARPDYAGGNYATVSSNRVVSCGFLDKGKFNVGGSCSYVIACN